MLFYERCTCSVATVNRTPPPLQTSLQCCIGAGVIVSVGDFKRPGRCNALLLPHHASLAGRSITSHSAVSGSTRHDRCAVLQRWVLHNRSLSSSTRAFGDRGGGSTHTPSHRSALRSAKI